MGGTLTGIGTGPPARAVRKEITGDADAPAAVKLYTCDVTSEDDPTPDVNDRLLLERAEGTFGPTKPECFEEKTLLYRYLVTVFEGDEPRGRQGIAFATQKQIPKDTYRIATIFTCVDAPSGFCAVWPFYGVVARREDARYLRV